MRALWVLGAMTVVVGISGCMIVESPIRGVMGTEVKWGEEVRDVGKFVGWLAGSLLLLGALMVFSAVAAAGLLWLLWWMLNLVFVVMPGWFAGLWS